MCLLVLCPVYSEQIRPNKRSEVRSRQNCEWTHPMPLASPALPPPPVLGWVLSTPRRFSALDSVNRLQEFLPPEKYPFHASGNESRCTNCNLHDNVRNIFWLQVFRWGPWIRLSPIPTPLPTMVLIPGPQNVSEKSHRVFDLYLSSKRKCLFCTHSVCGNIHRGSDVPALSRLGHKPYLQVIAANLV